MNKLVCFLLAVSHCEPKPIVGISINGANELGRGLQDEFNPENVRFSLLNTAKFCPRDVFLTCVDTAMPDIDLSFKFDFASIWNSVFALWSLINNMSYLMNVWEQHICLSQFGGNVWMLELSSCFSCWDDIWESEKNITISILIVNITISRCI